MRRPVAIDHRRGGSRHKAATGSTSGSHKFFAKASCAPPAQAAIGAAPASAAKRVGRTSVVAPASAATSRTAATTTILQPTWTSSFCFDTFRLAVLVDLLGCPGQVGPTYFVALT